LQDSFNEASSDVGTSSTGVFPFRENFLTAQFWGRRWWQVILLFSSHFFQLFLIEFSSKKEEY